jgi:hypothetical protein
MVYSGGERPSDHVTRELRWAEEESGRIDRSGKVYRVLLYIEVRLAGAGLAD